MIFSLSEWEKTPMATERGYQRIYRSLEMNDVDMRKSYSKAI